MSVINAKKKKRKSCNKPQWKSIESEKHGEKTRTTKIQ